MLRNEWIAALLGAAAMLIPFGALAQARDVGFYAGASIGSADLGPDDDTAVKVFGGYQIDRTFAAEFGYTDLGDVVVIGQTAKANAWELVGLAKFPVGNRVSLYGLLGLAKVDSERSVFGVRTSDDSTELTIGFGAQYDFSPQLGVRGQWQRYDTDQEIDVFSIGFVYKF
jgi:OOP family OmpA-OmpF porin